jgi:hypothetical protein
MYGELGATYAFGQSSVVLRLNQQTNFQNAQM